VGVGGWVGGGRWSMNVDGWVIHINFALVRIEDIDVVLALRPLA